MLNYVELNSIKILLEHLRDTCIDGDLRLVSETSIKRVQREINLLTTDYVKATKPEIRDEEGIKRVIEAADRFNKGPQHP